MSTNINANVLKNFIIKQLGSNHLTEKAAQKHGISADQYKEANVDENRYLELDEILGDTELYEQFATLYTVEQDKKAEAKDKENDKAEQAKVQDKNGAGV